MILIEPSPRTASDVPGSLSLSQEETIPVEGMTLFGVPMCGWHHELIDILKALVKPTRNASKRPHHPAQLLKHSRAITEEGTSRPPVSSSCTMSSTMSSNVSKTAERFSKALRCWQQVCDGRTAHVFCGFYHAQVRTLGLLIGRVAVLHFRHCGDDGCSNRRGLTESMTLSVTRPHLGHA